MISPHSSLQNLASIRGLPDIKMLGLPRNVLVWDGEQLATWLDALGLGDVAPNFLHHDVNGGTVRPPNPYLPPSFSLETPHDTRHTPHVNPHSSHFTHE